MREDEIMAELRASRDAYARRFDYDLEAIFRDLQEKQGQRTDREILQARPPRIAVGKKSHPKPD